MLDLYHADRDELIRIILEQRETILDQERQIATLAAAQAELRQVLTQLTAQVGTLQQQASHDDDPSAGTPQRMPGHKPTQAPPRGDRPRKKRAKGSGRHRMQPTARVRHALRRCPDCGAPLAGGTVKRTREVLEVPVPRVMVTEHVYLERRCPDCGKRCVPRPHLEADVAGHSRLGHGLVSLITVLREAARLPFATIQDLLQTLYGLHLSVGALVLAVARVAHRATSEVDRMTTTIRASPVVHADETGWREAGQNGYVWTFSTPDVRLFRHGSRAKAMVTDVLGDDFGGVLVSDFYAAYTNDARMHQYCWAHLLRDIRAVVEQHPEDAAVRGWAEAVGAVFARAEAGASGSQAQRWRVRQHAEVDLRELCAPWQEPRVPQTRLCTRILCHLEHLFVFVTESGVPPTNNAAERSLRPLVISRKISGGTRSEHGTMTKLRLASLFGTWRVQGRNPYDACRDLLATQD
jgi:transposase